MTRLFLMHFDSIGTKCDDFNSLDLFLIFNVSLKVKSDVFPYKIKAYIQYSFSSVSCF